MRSFRGCRGPRSPIGSACAQWRGELRLLEMDLSTVVWHKGGFLQNERMPMRPFTVFIAGCILGCNFLQLAVAADPPASKEPGSPKPAAAQESLTATEPPPASSVGVATSPAAVAAREAADFEAQTKRWRSKGYRPVVRDGKTLYCRSETQLGSHFEHQVCATPEQLEATARAAQEYGRDIQRGGGLGNRAPGN